MALYLPSAEYGKKVHSWGGMLLHCVTVGVQWGGGEGAVVRKRGCVAHRNVFHSKRLRERDLAGDQVGIISSQFC